MNILYLTNNIESVRDISKKYAAENNMEWFGFKNNRENMNNILSLYENNDNCIIFLEGLTKSNVSNALLKVLEDTKKNIQMFAVTNTYDTTRALEARFIIKSLENETNVSTNFITNKSATKEQYSSLQFYIDLAKLVVDMEININNNLMLINNIIKDIRLTTNNTLWDYYYMELKKKFRW